MAVSTLNAPKQSQKIYRFYLTNGEVDTDDIPVINQSYASDNLFYIDNGKIKSRYSGTVLIATHIIGSTANNTSQRLWATIKGGNVSPEVLKYGAYASADNVQIAQVDTSTEIYVQFKNPFTLGGGSTGYSFIFITIL